MNNVFALADILGLYQHTGDTMFYDGGLSRLIDVAKGKELHWRDTSEGWGLHGLCVVES